MAFLKPRLVRGEKETRAERVLREIRERRAGENVPFGEGEIDNSPFANVIQVDAVLQGSYRKTDYED